MIKACIFDLDNCLAAADEVGTQLFEPAFDAVRKANHDKLSEQSLEQAFTDCWFRPLDWVAARYGFSNEMLSAAWTVFATMEVQGRMVGYGDLAALSDLPVQRFLVTSGFRRLQESKVRALNVESLFDAIHIDAIDERNRLGKQALFQRIISANGFNPLEVLVIGDNQDSEIEAGNRLGVPTVQILRPGVVRGDKATFYVTSLDELSSLL